jgi:RNA polymerase sigma-70 factor (ECF subfamily)
MASSNSRSCLPQFSIAGQTVSEADSAGLDVRLVLEELYQTHCSPLRRAALNWVGNVHDAEDAVQEAFLKAYRNAASFAGQATLSTWLYRILLNVCHDFGRRRRRRPEQQEVGGAPDATRLQPFVTEDHPTRISLERTLRRLSPRYSAVLLMFEVEGLKHSEIAAMLRISEGASKSRLSEARRQLRTMLSTPNPSRTVLDSEHRQAGLHLKANSRRGLIRRDADRP